MFRLVVLALLLSTPAALACPAQEWSQVPATPNDTVLADDGGVLFAMQSDRGGGPMGAVGYRLRSNGAPVEANDVQLAAGISLLVPKTPGTRTLEVVDMKGKVVRTYKQEPAGPKLAAPRGTVKSTLSKAAVAKWAKLSNGYGIPSGQMTIALDADAPADVVGLIVYDAQTKQGLAFGHPDRRAITFYQGGKGCGGPENAVALIGKRVVLGWIDARGRMSALSAPITVGVQKP